jgi:hypothetical protein
LVDGGAPDAAPVGCAATGPSFARCGENPVVSGWRQVAGGFEWTQADPYVLFDADDGLYKMWFSALVVSSCSKVTTNEKRVYIKYAESKDGLRWTVQEAPALDVGAKASDWDHSTVETPTVIKLSNNAKGKFALLYAGANEALPKLYGTISTWQVGIAYSDDGKAFRREPATQSPYYDSRVTPFLPEGMAGLALFVRDAFPDAADVTYGTVADPEIAWDGTRYHLWFSSAGAVLAPSGNYEVLSKNGAPLYGISHATSTDLRTWTATGGNPVFVGTGQPSVSRVDGQFRMIFSDDREADLAAIPSFVFPTRGFVEATSPDGTSWTRRPGRVFEWSAGEPLEDLGLLAGAAIVTRGSDDLLFYNGWSSSKVTAGSCALVKNGADAGLPFRSVPGTSHLGVAVRRRAP